MTVKDIFVLHATTTLQVFRWRCAIQVDIYYIIIIDLYTLCHFIFL